MKRSFFTSRRLLFGTVVLLVFSSLLNARFSRWCTSTPRSVVTALIVPLQRPFTWISQKLRPRAPRPLDLGDPQTLATRYKEAQAYNRRLWLQLDSAREKIAQLEGLKQVRSVTGHKELPATVIGVSVDSGNPTITIDRGSSDKVRAGCAVVGPYNFVGLVNHVSSARSTVGLITSPQTEFQVAITPPSAGEPARRLDTRLIWERKQRGFTAVVGRDKSVQINDLAHLADIGYPSGAHGYVVGVVTAVEDYEENPLLFRKLTVKPTVSLVRLQHVVVLVPVKG